MEWEQFGPYRLEALLGRGGMGEVYRAFDTEHDRVVALKVLSPVLALDTSYRERFRREAHHVARLNEPHIVPIHRYGEIEGRLFLDMRLIPGRDAAAILEDDGPLDPARAVSIVSQTARALDSAHADGLVHRDVKPSNIVLTGSGDDEFVYLLDFGIARSTSDAPGPVLTQTGAALGSFDYMAPERFLEAPIDKRVDVYALACVLFECLTGRRPFTGEGLARLMYAHVHTDAPAPTSIRPELPAGIDAVVAKGLTKDPDQRYGSCGELAAAARDALRASGVTPSPVPGAPPTTIHPQRTPPPVPGTGDQPPGPDTDRGTGRNRPSHRRRDILLAAAVLVVAAGTALALAMSGLWDGGGERLAAATGSTAAPTTSATATATGSNAASTTGSSPAETTGGSDVPTAGGGGGPTAGGGPAATAGRTSATTPAGLPTTARNPAPPVPGPPSTTTAPPTVSPPTAEDRLRAMLPSNFVEQACLPDSPDGGELVKLVCDNAVSGGPTGVAAYLYPDAGSAAAAFQNEVLGDGRPVVADTTTLCRDAQGYGRYTDPTGSGSVACWVDSNNNAAITWTRDGLPVGGSAAIRGGGVTGLRTLYAWWVQTANHAFTSG